MMCRLFCTSLLAASALQSTGEAPPLETLAEDHVGAMVAGGNVVSAALLIQTGDEVQTFFFGETTPGSGQKPDGSTCYEIGSITKTFTAALLARAVEEETLRLDQPLAKRFTEGPEPLAKLPEAITFEGLATHHAGVPRLPDNLRPKDSANPYLGYDDTALYGALAELKVPAEAPPYEYSNFGYALLGHALALAADSSYEDLVRVKIFDPLGMTRSTVHPTAANRASCAPPHTLRRIRITGPRFREVSGWDFEAFAPAGSIVSTVDDMGRYLGALLQPDDTLFDKLRAPLIEEREQINEELAVGLGWHLIQRDARKTLVWHNGGTGGYSSFLGFYPEAGMGVVLLTNTANTAAVDGAAIGLLESLYDQQD